MKVLAVDDDPRLLDALEVGLQLQWQEAQVLTATDGEAGLDRFLNEHPDLVLLDVVMPRLSGFEVLKAIRQISDVPVIMLTARGDDVDELVRNAGQLLPHAALLDRVWGHRDAVSPLYLKVFISHLRAKLHRPGGPEYIETERGRGYRFVRPSVLEPA